MTPGQRALLEAAMRESALVYGRTVPEYKATPEAPEPLAQRLAEAIADGWSNSEIMAKLPIDYAGVSQARKQQRKANK